jgi:hypothetical protein
MLWLETYALSLIVHVLTVLPFMMRVDSTNRSLSWLTRDLVVLIRGSIRRHFEVVFLRKYSLCRLVVRLRGMYGELEAFAADVCTREL